MLVKKKIPIDNYLLPNIIYENTVLTIRKQTPIANIVHF